MSRVSDIINLTLPGSGDSFGLLAAYCQCLTPSQSCELLYTAAVERVDLRAPTLRKVCNDIGTEFRPCHAAVIEELLVSLPLANARKRQSLGYCLSSLAACAPAEFRAKVLSAFIASPFITVRRRGYKALGAGDCTPFFDTIRTAWERFGDHECAWLITKHFPVTFLVEQRKALSNVMFEGWQLSRLYLRISENSQSMLPELKTLDPVSYCYVKAKLNDSISLSEAKEIIEYAALDSRLSLLVWSLGKMGNWEALLHVQAQLPAIHERRIEAIMSLPVPTFGGPALLE